MREMTSMLLRNFNLNISYPCLALYKLRTFKITDKYIQTD